MTLRLTRAQVREIDRRATADYWIPSIVLMENAARSAADVAMEMLAGINNPRVCIICGAGNNGGDGYAIARHLHNRGVGVFVMETLESAPEGDAATNRAIIGLMDVEIDQFVKMPRWIETFDLWIDALFGTGLSRPIEGDRAKIVTLLNERNRKVLAIDLPSGLDCDTGEPLGPCVRATKTVTFGAEKAGFANPRSREFTGEVVIGDIGVPPELVLAVATGGQ